MKVYPDKLDQALGRGTAPIYLVHGDEPLQLDEVGDRLRRHARDEGYEERTVIVANEDADWARLRAAGDTMSLFAERRLVELRLPTGKPGRAGAEALKAWASAPPTDVLLLIRSAKLDRGGSSSAWFKAIDKIGVTIAVWPVEASRLPAWLKDRLARHGLVATPEALSLIADRVEGNLLAAAQEAERLALLYPSGSLDADQVLAAVADSSRFSIADIAPAVMRGDVTRAVRILRGLADTGEAPVLVLWALSQEVRAGTRVAEALAAGAGMDAAMKGAGVWASRQADLKLALARHDVGAWLGSLADISHLDRLTKGQEPGDVWIAFERLCVAIAESASSTCARPHALV